MLSRDAAVPDLDMGRTACGTRVCFCSGRPGNESSNYVLTATNTLRKSLSA